MLYKARVSDRRGRLLYTSDPHGSREAATAQAWLNRPKAPRCSTSLCNVQGQDMHSDIRFHVKDGQ